ncbi:CBS domain-containing protein [Vallitalea okinawensis]|uniref:CBS domain-containing protein n=1 Tax=Vallitalea okinawensis TaxID=2078660 RepID=UPI000CFD01E2|nr:CBS domain-containing protein [Vallitalea okinawensis]
MNIAFFLTPKSEVIYLKKNMTMRQALEKMEYHRYTSVAVIDDDGRYDGTITEGDLLWLMKNNTDLTFKDTSKIKLDDVPRHRSNTAVSINADIESLVELASCQNFVPVVDDNGVFIGIIKRSDIINYYYNIMKQARELSLNAAV